MSKIDQKALTELATSIANIINEHGGSDTQTECRFRKETREERSFVLKEIARMAKFPFHVTGVQLEDPDDHTMIEIICGGECLEDGKEDTCFIKLWINPDIVKACREIEKAFLPRSQSGKGDAS